jgi:hypothetical protein
METYIVCVIILACILGAIVNYLWHKWDSKKLDTITKRTLIFKIIMGATAGVLLSASVTAMPGVGVEIEVTDWAHAILLGFPIGAVAEKYIARYTK